MQPLTLLIGTLSLSGGSINFTQVPDPSENTADMFNEKQVVTLHGIILRSQLVTLLKKGVFYPECDGVSLY